MDTQPRSLTAPLAEAPPPLIPAAGTLFIDSWLWGGPGLLAAGKRWDAVRVAEHHGAAALAELRRYSQGAGAILAHRRQWWFFVPVQSTDQPWPPIATYLTTGSYITIPPPHATQPDPTKPYWIQPSNAEGHELTSSLFLRPILEVISERRS